MKTNIAKRIALGLLAAAMLPAGPARASWIQIGWFRGDTRNVSVSDTVVRVVSALTTDGLPLKGDFVTDSAMVARLYPGWDYAKDLVVYYTVTAKGFSQSSFEYGFGVDRKPLPGDTITVSLAAFDIQGTRKVKTPTPLRATLGDTALLVATLPCQCDSDNEEEWIVVNSAPRDSSHKAAPESLRLYDHQGKDWQVVMSVELTDPVRPGPLEVRDLTRDGLPDIIYRCFMETEGHFWVDVHVLSSHKGLLPMLEPALFNPGLATGPVLR